MVQHEGGEEVPVKKPTGFMSNSPKICERLRKLCPGKHRHISLTGGRAKIAEIYPDALCSEILKGVIEQMRIDGRIGNGGDVGAVMAEEQTMNWEEFWDDISGEPLDPLGVHNARKEEMAEIAKHKVYTKVPLTECWEKTGKAPIGVRWVDVNKGDKVHAEYRSRLVAKEIKVNKRDDLFAATPPLEAQKMLLSWAVTEGVGYHRGNKMKGMKLDFIDVRRAYFHAAARREVYVELSAEERRRNVRQTEQVDVRNTRCNTKLGIRVQWIPRGNRIHQRKMHTVCIPSC
jgi:hypothetical protein